MMSRYDRIYERLATRAVRQGGVDIETFMAQMIDAGVSETRLQQMLLQDVEEGGPIFGKFLRSLTGAAESSVLAAERQGDVAGTVASDAELQELLDLADRGLVEDADPEALARIEDAVADRIDYTWVAMLVNTCPKCLPLHGSTRLLSEWEELGLHPDTIHEGWNSPCHCSLVPTSEAAGRKDLIDPLTRERLKTETGLKASKKTQRAVAQADIAKAQNAVKQAANSLEGRRTLRLLGKVNESEE